MVNIISRFSWIGRGNDEPFLLDSQKITTIVGILAKDVTVVAKWTELYYKLGVSMDIDRLKTRRNAGNLNCHDLFRDIIEKWRSEQGSRGTVKTLCHILESIQCVHASEAIIAALNINEEDLTGPIFFGFDRMSKNFTGRCKQMEDIEKMLKGDFVKIIGMGGIGKTELAKKFANLHQRWNCIWLNAENAQILTTSVTRLGESIGIRDESIELIDLFRSCLAAIKKRNAFEVLVIVDNVDADYAEAIAVVGVVKDQTNCFAIVTSRNIGVMGYAGDATNKLETLDNLEAIKLVCSSLDGESDQDILSLCQKLDNFPLALQQAVAFIKQKQLKGVLQKSFKIPQYLQHYKIEKEKLLNHPLVKLEHEYSKTTLITWQTSIDAIKAEGKVGKISIDLLNIIAYMEADKIPLQFIKDIYNKFEGPTVLVNESIELLIAYSLVRVEREEISVHRLVQEVVRVHLTDNKVIIKLISCFDRDFKDSLERGGERGQVYSVWRYFSQLQDDNLERQFMSNRINVINQFFLLRNVDDKFYGESVEIANRVLGKDDKQTLIFTSRVACFPPFSSISDYDIENVEHLRAVFIKQTEFQEEEESLITGYLLWFTLLRCSKDHEAVELLKTIRRLVHHWTKLLFDVVYWLSDSLKDSGKVGDAAEMDEFVLESITKQKGADHPWVQSTRDELGSLYLYLDDKTKKECQRALAVVIRVFGQKSEQVIELKSRISKMKNFRERRREDWSKSCNPS